MLIFLFFFRILFTKIKIEEILYGFNYSVNSLLNLIRVYKQKLAIPNEKYASFDHDYI